MGQEIEWETTWELLGAAGLGSDIDATYGRMDSVESCPPPPTDGCIVPVTVSGNAPLCSTADTSGGLKTASLALMPKMQTYPGLSPRGLLI